MLKSVNRSYDVCVKRREQAPAIRGMSHQHPILKTVSFTCNRHVGHENIVTVVHRFYGLCGNTAEIFLQLQAGVMQAVGQHAVVAGVVFFIFNSPRLEH